MISNRSRSHFGQAQDPIGREVIAPDGKRSARARRVRDTYTGYTRQPDGPCIYMLRTIPVRGESRSRTLPCDADPNWAAAVKNIARDLDPQMLVLSSTLRAQMDYNAEQDG